MAAEGELRLDAVLLGGEPEPVEAGHDAPGERLVGDVGQRCTPPEVGGAAQLLGGPAVVAGHDRPAGRGQAALEGQQVEFGGGEADEVPGALRQHELGAAEGGGRRRQRLAQVRHVDLERARRPVVGLVAPQRVDDAVDGDHVVDLDQEQRQEAPRPDPAEWERDPVDRDLEGPADAEGDTAVHWRHA